MSNNKPVCLAPFLSIYSNPVGYSPCCYISPVGHESLDDYLTSDWLNQLREAHLKNDKARMHTRCTTCMAKSVTTFFSELGYEKNGELSQYWDRGGRDFIYFYLAPDITCGMSCGMCLVSDKRLDELSDWGIRDEIGITDKTAEHKNMPVEEVTRIYDNLKHARLVSIYGGDPTMSLSTIDIIANTPADATVRYSSNGQFTKLRNGDGLIDALSKFEQVHFTVSLDGLGEIGLRTRKGINFKNMDKLIRLASEQANFSVEICMTVSLYNVVEVVRLYDEIYEQYIETGLADGLFFNPVYEPSYMAVGALPAELKKKVIGELAMLMVKATGEKKAILNRSYALLIRALRAKVNPSEWHKFIKVCRREEDAAALTPIVKLIPVYRPFFETLIC
ncbi:radical SAM protein [Vibrio sp. MEBiC08052]|uniref:radical SAM protein n=1 Tax=Vibrio sp. MEBiC08052 TaxID=1761910 RepID=UPI00074071EB|nr:radical SAM protein [Vibrio sp. MEBiC08052]KUI98357.1 hypothetical protein VRK_30580 [Vibrio sp. MEBiC08052]